MLSSNLLFVATLLGAVTAAPSPQESLPKDFGIYNWEVFHLWSYCEKVPECPYDFEIRGQPHEEDGVVTPEFRATCKGTKEGDAFVPCEFGDGEAAGRNLSSRLEPLANPEEKGKKGSLVITYQFTDAQKQTWNYTNALTEFRYDFIGIQSFDNMIIPKPVKVAP